MDIRKQVLEISVKHLGPSSIKALDVKGISLQLRYDKINQMEKRKIMKTNMNLKCDSIKEKGR